MATIKRGCIRNESAIIVNSFEKFTQWQLVFDHPNFKPKDIINLLNYAYKEY